jgi:diguanylate cyclase (GGDEF)-like protein
VLVVDDDPGLVETVAWVLRDHGYEVATAAGAAEFTAYLEPPAEAGPRERRPPDLVLLDILMPDGDGVALLERAKRDERWRDVPVLMLSSAPAEEYTVRALGLGAADFVRKPVRPRELVARVQAHLRAGAALRTTREALRRTEEELARARADAENRRKLVDILHEVTGDLAADEIYHLLARRVARAHERVALRRGARRPTRAGRRRAAGDRRRVAHRVRGPAAAERRGAARPLPRGGGGARDDGAGAHRGRGGRRALRGRRRRGDGARRRPVRGALGARAAVRRRPGPGAARSSCGARASSRALTRDDVAFAEAVIGAAVAVVQRAQVIETARADNARLEQLATTDPLTALLNRRALTERLTTEMERALRYDGTVALLLIDLDHFKRVNDTHGHLVGDAVLRGVAELLVQAVRTSDMVGRYGGEEFLVVLPETDDEGAASFAERVREQVAAHEFRAWDDGRALRMTASIGVATFPAARIENVVDLFARADAALYRAKADGRDRVRM